MREYITKEQALRRFADFGREIPKDQVFEVITSLQEEIVRCKKCKYFRESKDPDNPWSLCTGRADRSIYVEPDGFCSDGRRKETDE